METTVKTKITVKATINAPVETVWNKLTNPKHILYWNNASDDWYTPRAENDLRAGGRFMSRMESRDGKHGFEFSGTYSRVVPYRLIEYTLDDERKVKLTLESNENETKVEETFEAEPLNPVELQQTGWQAILNNFKKYVETSRNKERLHFEIDIHASPEKVYETMIGEKAFSEWTAEFNPTSHFKGSWNKGSKIHFIGTDKDGSTGGMAGLIRENIPNKFVSVEYYAVIKNDEEIKSGPEAEAWAGGIENYFFTDLGGTTRVSVDADANLEFKNYFLETWPKALNKLKSICESE